MPKIALERYENEQFKVTINDSSEHIVNKDFTLIELLFLVFNPDQFPSQVTLSLLAGDQWHNQLLYTLRKGMTQPREGKYIEELQSSVFYAEPISDFYTDLLREARVVEIKLAKKAQEPVSAESVVLQLEPVPA